MNKQDKIPGWPLLLAVTLLLAMADFCTGYAGTLSVVQTYPYESPSVTTTILLYTGGHVPGLLLGLMLMHRSSAFVMLCLCLTITAVLLLLLVGTHITPSFEQMCLSCIALLFPLSILLSWGLFVGENAFGQRSVSTILATVLAGMLTGIALCLSLPASTILSVAFFILLAVLSVCLFVMDDYRRDMARY